MKWIARLLRAFLLLAVAGVVLPPLWYTLVSRADPPPLPEAGRRVALAGGVGVNVLEEGTGPPVVLSHGLPGMASDWRLLSASLAERGFRAIAYDRVGYGHSDPRTNGRYTVRANAEELIALLDALELEDAIVAGWSFGGATAMTAAGIDDSRIGKLVLIGTGGPDRDDARPPPPPLAMRIFYSAPVRAWVSAVPPVGIGAMRALSDAAYSGGPQPDWWIPGLIANFSRSDARTTNARESTEFAADIAATDFDVRAIRRPTLLLHGDDDRLAPVGISRYLAVAIPDATLVEFPGASHMLPVTHGSELADQIARFARAE